MQSVCLIVFAGFVLVVAQAQLLKVRIFVIFVANVTLKIVEIAVAKFVALARLSAIRVLALNLRIKKERLTKDKHPFQFRKMNLILFKPIFSTERKNDIRLAKSQHKSKSNNHQIKVSCCRISPTVFCGQATSCSIAVCCRTGSCDWAFAKCCATAT